MEHSILEEHMRPSFVTTVGFALALSTVGARVAAGQVMPKAQVANLIVKVENGVDEFRKYLERRGDNAKDAKDSKDNGSAAGGRRSRQGASENQKAKASAKKDKLEDALDELNRSTNRLRRKFD